MFQKKKPSKPVEVELVDFDLDKFLDSKPATKWDNLYWWITRGIWGKIYEIKYVPRNVCDFFQRGMIGWSPRDLWNFDHYLTKIILNGLVEFKRTKSGYPAIIDPAIGKFTGDPDKDYNEERWDAILGQMIEGFALLMKCQIGDELQYGGYMTDKEKLKSHSDERWKKFGIARYTTREEEEKIKHAFDLLRDHFWSLVD